MAPGCLVRQGPELSSTKVCELDAGTEVVATESTILYDKKYRVPLVIPVKGWVSEKQLEPYGTGHAIPRPLAVDKRNHLPTVARRSRKIKVGATGKTLASATDEEQKPYNWDDPYERWVCETMSGRNPADPDVRSAYAVYLGRRHNRLEEARDKLEAVAREFPECVEARKGLGWVDAEMRKRAPTMAPKAAADAEFSRRNWRSAATKYREALVEARDDLSASRLRANLSACYFKMRRWKDAETEARRAISADPTWPKARLRLSAALEASGSVVAAQFALRDFAADDALSAKTFNRLQGACEARERQLMNRGEFETMASTHAIIEGEYREVDDLAGDDVQDKAEMADALPDERRKAMRADKRRKEKTMKSLFAPNDDSESSMSSSEGDTEDDERREEENRESRLEASYAAKQAMAAEAKRIAAATLEKRRDETTTHSMTMDLDMAGRGLAIEDGEVVAQKSSRKAASTLVPLVGEVACWCVTIVRRGEPVLGVAESGAVPSTSLENDPHSWALVCGQSSTKLVSRGRTLPHTLRPFKEGETVGFVWDSSSKRLDVYVDGKLRRLNVFPELLSGERKLYAFVGFGTSPVLEAGKCRFVSGQIDDPDRRVALDRYRGGRKKSFSLVDADGKPHARRLKVKHPFRMCNVYERGDGVENAVWCETGQARWTQSVEKVEIIAIRAPKSLRAVDCDVTVRVRYLKAVDSTTGDVLIEGTLARDIVPDESLWFIDDDGTLQFVLAKCLAALHAGAVSDGNWDRLFEFDDALSNDDMDDDRTDLAPDRQRLERLAAMKSSQQAKYEGEKRRLVEKAGKSWTWVHTDDKEDPIAPSYMVPDQIGYDVPCDRQLVLKEAGCLEGA